uniref:hypothetical protein n=1 Tax=Gracilaria cliftonii TaxID=206548 RepID=UPI001D11E39E|nr:hypothetical protein LKZ11_pgp027 [Gracilaria cliftonii]UAD84656.1 hypothetical protein [Gracilaria cliftonii]
MYFYQKSSLNSSNYHFVIFQSNYIFILSSFSYKIIAWDCLYFYHINNCISSMFSKHLLKLFVFIMILYGSNSILEVRINNFRALSLYYWLGFSIVHIRLYYYILSISPSSAYSLINTKSISQNIFRRYLILDVC